MKHKTSTKDLRLTSNERIFLDSKSIFRPTKYKNINPNGLKIYTFNSGFKKKYKDLLIIIFDNLANNYCVYSNTSTPSAPIIWDKKNNKGKCKALIINSGNANAHTGKEGINIIENYVKKLSNKIKCNINEILVSSTGVIGEIFNPKKINSQIDKLDTIKSTSIIDAAKTIMTTDTFPKTFVKKIKIDGEIVNIFGFAKGSGMIHPNMGTMLAYIFIDAHIASTILKQILNKYLDQTFNSISVDSDTSTSDTLAFFSLKHKKINIKKIKNLQIISKEIYKIMHDLSQQIIKDGEGLSKLIKVVVNEAKNKKQAEKIAFSIINSPLVKTAIAGEDANWGRIIMAIGKSYEKIDQNKIKIFFGKNIVCKNGSAYKKINNKKIDKYMKNKIINIKVNLGLGNFSKTVFGNDLTHEYVRINGDYRS